MRILFEERSIPSKGPDVPNLSYIRDALTVCDLHCSRVDEPEVAKVSMSDRRCSNPARRFNFRFPPAYSYD